MLCYDCPHGAEHPASNQHRVAVVLLQCFHLGIDAYSGANKQVGPTFVVVFGPLQIVFTAILQLLIFHTPISEGSYIGGSLVSVGLFMLVAGRVVEEAEAQKVLERTNQYYRGPAGRWDDMRKSRNAQEARDGLLQ